MFKWFRQINVITRLRGLALLALAAMLALTASLLWSGYQQRLADRQAALHQTIELANASVQWSYSRQHFGKLSATQARAQTLAALNKLKHNTTDRLFGNQAQSGLLLQGALAIGVVLLVGLMMWAGIEIATRELKAAPQLGAASTRAASHGPYREVTQVDKDRYAAFVASVLPTDEAGDASPDAATREVNRLRMAGAI